ncbi:MAG: YdeI/OmpD-associated family protein [Cyclobacteriaceae bacterium]
MESHKSVEQYILKKKQWTIELTTLREILVSTGMKEEVKWGTPVYSYKGKNIAGIAAFKSYVGLWFYQGALLKDAKEKLINAQEGKTRALRQWRFTSIKEVTPKLIKTYLKEAIQNARDGKEIKPHRDQPIVVPQELASYLKADTSTLKSFHALSKSKQREYTEYIAEAAKPETKTKRIEKILPLILQGVGLHDKYK